MRFVLMLLLVSGCVVGEKITTVTGPTGPMGATGPSGLSADVARLDTHDAQLAQITQQQARQTMVTFAATHGVEVEIDNPFSSLPAGFQIIDARSEDGAPLSVIQSAKVRSIPDTTKLGITVDYDLRHTEPCLVMSASIAQDLVHNTNTLMAGWNTTHLSRGSVISQSAGVFTVSEAGRYLVVFKMRFGTGVTYTFNYVSIRQTAEPLLNVNIGEARVAAAQTEAPFLSTSAILDLNAGGTFETRGLQANGSGATYATGSSPDGRIIQIYRLHNDSTPTGTVRGILYAGP